jgi:hypothetical protein
MEEVRVKCFRKDCLGWSQWCVGWLGAGSHPQWGGVFSVFLLVHRPTYCIIAQPPEIREPRRSTHKTMNTGHHLLENSTIELKTRVIFPGS